MFKLACFFVKNLLVVLIFFSYNIVERNGFMEYKITENRIYAENDEGKVLAEIEFSKEQDNVYNIFHTFVDDSLRGQGVASILVEMAVHEIESRGYKVTATCSYAEKWLNTHK